MKEKLLPNSDVIKEAGIQEFIADRKISKEDFSLLEQLAKFPKGFFHDMHNFFNLSKDRSVNELKNQIKGQTYAEKKKFLETLLTFTEKYNWAVSWNLIRIFEERK